jgi:hypothetical protein
MFEYQPLRESDCPTFSQTPRRLFRLSDRFQLSLFIAEPVELGYELMSEEERARRQPEAEESRLSTLYFQHSQNRSAKTYVHATHTVHALPDLRIAAGRILLNNFDHFEDVFGDRQVTRTAPGKAHAATV